MNSIRYTLSQQILGDIFSRTFKKEFFFEFLTDEDSLVVDILLSGASNPDAVSPAALEGKLGSDKWMEMLLTAIEHTYPHENIETKLALAAKAAIHFRESMSAEIWFGFISAPAKKIRGSYQNLLTMYIEALVAAALSSGNPTMMIDLVGLAIPKSDLLYYSGPFPAAILSYVYNHPDVLSMFTGAPSKLIAQVALKYEIWGLGSLLNLEDRGTVFTQEMGV